MHESELETILSGDIDGHPVALNPRTELPRGMFDWTTKDTLIGDRGGWNCRHQFFGVSDSAVHEEVRKKLENKIKLEGDIKKLNELNKDKNSGMFPKT